MAKRRSCVSTTTRCSGAAHSMTRLELRAYSVPTCLPCCARRYHHKLTFDEIQTSTRPAWSRCVDIVSLSPTYSIAGVCLIDQRLGVCHSREERAGSWRHQLQICCPAQVLHTALLASNSVLSTRRRWRHRRFFRRSRCRIAILRILFQNSLPIRKTAHAVRYPMGQLGEFFTARRLDPTKPNPRRFLV